MADFRLLGTGLLVGGFALGWLLRPQIDPPSPPPAVMPVSSAAPALPAAPSASASAAAKPASSQATQEAFEAIYKNAVWGRNDASVGNSGTGSTLEATLIYRTFLAQFMKNNDIHSVVDAGCGDWEFSQAIDWTGIDYKGFDIVPAVVAHDKKKYEKPNIHFFNESIITYDLPKADLLISKHVLQHLPNADIQKFLTVHVPKYKHVLLMNGVNPYTFSGGNPDIAPGDYRPIDLTAPPFNMVGLKVLNYFDGHDMHSVLHIAPKKS